MLKDVKKVDETYKLMEYAWHIIVELVGAIGMLLLFSSWAVNFVDAIVKRFEAKEKRMEMLLRDESVIHQLIKEKLEVIEIKNREDLKQVTAEIISIVTKLMK